MLKSMAITAHQRYSSSGELATLPALGGRLGPVAPIREQVRSLLSWQLHCMALSETLRQLHTTEDAKTRHRKEMKSGILKKAEKEDKGNNEQIKNK